ncbi:MAG: type VI secretion system tip protein TssI/VgrG, partial [Gemmatimonadaceae bacterium]
AIPKATRFRPARVTPRPTMQGTQTALVVGVDADGDIDVDKEGAILLEFPWDQGAGMDKKSKHRVHVASAWAGKNWGFIQTPRVGQEVLVEYIEGDLERPVVTGSVYNSKHPHPFPLPGDSTKSGWRSQTLKGEGENHNEIHFEDKKGSEQLFVQAEKDMVVNIKHDRTTKIKNDDTRTLEEGNDTHTVTKGKQTITIKQDHALTVQDGNHAVKVEKGNMSTKVSLGNITVDADAGSITIKAAQKIELKVGGNSIVIDMTGVTIKGTMVKSEAQAISETKGAMVKIEGSGMTQIKAPMTQVNGDGMLMLKGGVTMIN